MLKDISKSTFLVVLVLSFSACSPKVVSLIADILSIVSFIDSQAEKNSTNRVNYRSISTLQRSVFANFEKSNSILK